jgi:hypothetical protein
MTIRIATSILVAEDLMLRSVHPTAAPIMGLRKALMARRIG